MVLRNTFIVDYHMPNTLTPEQKAELLKRLEMARQAKQAKQAQKAPAKSKSAKKSNSTESSTSQPQDAPPIQTVQDCPQKPTADTTPSPQIPQTSSPTMNVPEQQSSKTPTEISVQSQPQEIPTCSTVKRGRKKVCLPVSSDTDSSDEEEKPKKRRGRKPYATIVLHKEPKKSIDKVIQRLSRIESSSSESDSEPEAIVSEPIPIPQKKNTRPVPQQLKSPHNQDEQRREILRRLAMEFYN